MSSLSEFWNKLNCFRIEHNELKRKEFIYTTPLKVSKHGLINLNFRPLLLADSINKYLRLNNRNTNFLISFNDLCLNNFLENKEEYNKLLDHNLKFLKRDLDLFNIGYSKDYLLNFQNENALYFMQKLFIELYELGFIKYDSLTVTHDPILNKIYPATFNHKNEVLKKVFYLDYSAITDRFYALLSNLPIPLNYRNQLLAFLDQEEVYRLQFQTNHDSLSVLTPTPELIGSISAIFLPIPMTNYVSEDELSGLNDFLNSDDVYFFTGNYAINQLNDYEIPIFLKKNIEASECLFSNSENLDLINELGLDYFTILDNDLLINSAFLDGLDVDAAREVLLERELITKTLHFKHPKLLLSQLDIFGLPIPISFSNSNFKLLKDNLPLAYSENFRLLVPNFTDLAFDESFFEETLNTAFINGADLLYKLFYDPNLKVTDILTQQNAPYFSAWTKKMTFVVGHEDLYHNLFVPLLFLTLYSHIYNVPFSTPEIIVLKPIYCLDGKLLSKYNYNLISLAGLVKGHQADSLRLYFTAIDHNADFFLNDNNIAKYDTFINSLCRFFMTLVNSHNYDYDQVFSIYEKKLNEALFSYDFNYYITELIVFYNKNIKSAKIKKEQLLRFLVFLFLVAPSVAEELFASYFKTNYSLLDQNWK